MPVHDPQNSPSNAPVLQSVSDAVVTLTLNRPDRLNALNHELGHALAEALHRLAEDRAVRAVILTGAGRGFCSGGDLNLLTSARRSNDSAQLQSLLEIGKQIVLIIAGMKKPVIAAVNGPAAGAGMNLALACTLRIASDSATFGESFSRIGLFPESFSNPAKK